MGLTLGDGLAILSVVGFLITLICYYGPKRKEEKINTRDDALCHQHYPSIINIKKTGGA